MLEVNINYYKTGSSGQGKYRASLTLLRDDKRVGSATGTFPTVDAVKRWGRDWKKARKAKHLTFEALR